MKLIKSQNNKNNQAKPNQTECDFQKEIVIIFYLNENKKKKLNDWTSFRYLVWHIFRYILFISNRSFSYMLIILINLMPAMRGEKPNEMHEFATNRLNSQ